MIIANWKMSLYPTEEIELFEELLKKIRYKSCMVVCPSLLSLRECALKLFQSYPEANFFLGGQSCSTEALGLQNGQVSARALKESGASFCLVNYFSIDKNIHEEESKIFDKIHSCFASQLIPVIFLHNPAERPVELKAEVAGYVAHGADLQEGGAIFVYHAETEAIDPMEQEEKLEAAATAIRSGLAGHEKNKKILLGGHFDQKRIKPLLDQGYVEGLYLENKSLNFQDLKNLLDLL